MILERPNIDPLECVRMQTKPPSDTNRTEVTHDAASGTQVAKLQ